MYLVSIQQMLGLLSSIQLSPPAHLHKQSSQSGIETGIITWQK